MNCPLCKKHTMDAIDLVPNLSGLTCSECKGVWIARSNYDVWRSKQPKDIPESSTSAEITVTDTHKPKLCPQCGRLLLPYRVGHGLSFSIDYCGACGGIWFDRNEWDAVKARNLHDNLHEIVSFHWQVAVRKDEVMKSIEQTYSRLLGPAYSKASETRDWLRKQSNKGLILAYLADMKPDRQ